jgi:hypothetical protein
MQAEDEKRRSTSSCEVAAVNRCKTWVASYAMYGFSHSACSR